MACCSSATRGCSSPITASSPCSPRPISATSGRPNARSHSSIGHHAEWIAACKTGSPTTCNFDYSGALTEAVLLGNVSYRSGKPLVVGRGESQGRRLPRGRCVPEHRISQGMVAVRRFTGRQRILVGWASPTFLYGNSKKIGDFPTLRDRPSPGRQDRVFQARIKINKHRQSNLRQVRRDQRLGQAATQAAAGSDQSEVMGDEDAGRVAGHLARRIRG